MARWALVVEENEGAGQYMTWSPRVLTEVEGTREEAVAALKQLVPGYTPRHPMSSRQRTLYRDGDSYLLVSQGQRRTFHTVFKVWEVLWDSNRPEIQGHRLSEEGEPAN
ncbi:hypothetical protein [Kitasatospora sp. GP82]|uniref:hypothetical protein n=1 Tax=Kitasatospora sp. GP82 TaxID=3035089 RepID=UPI0024747535|nr:hypothetical protein [Kitasatospora sp. GP82]MDH6125662.1 hypothetical protein [Kitasatospora sp. GP82]